MTKILHIMCQGEIGGLERNLYLLIREQMKDPDLKVGVIFGRAQGYYYEKIANSGCDISFSGIERGFDLTKSISIARELRKYDIHHFHNSAIPYVIGSILSGNKYRVLTYRGGHHRFSLLKRFRELVMSFFLHFFFDVFTGNTLHAAKVAANHYNIPLEDFKVTYNGVDFDAVRIEVPRNEMRSRLGLDNIHVIGTCAKFKKWKRIDILIRLVAKLENCKLLLVGDGPDKARLAKLANELGVGNKTIFTGLQSKVFDYVNAMDIFVLPSDCGESFGNAAVEAMGLGVPTIVFADGGGTTEHIISGETGFIVNGFNELEMTVKQLLQDIAVRQRIGFAGANSVKNRYTLLNMARSYKDVYISLVR